MEAAREITRVRQIVRRHRPGRDFGLPLTEALSPPQVLGLDKRLASLRDLPPRVG